MHTTFSFCPSFSWNYWSKVLHSFWATLYSHWIMIIRHDDDDDDDEDDGDDGDDDHDHDDYTYMYR